jgi:hypothetical protein
LWEIVLVTFPTICTLITDIMDTMVITVTTVIMVTTVTMAITVTTVVMVVDMVVIKKENESLNVILSRK